MFGCCDFAAMVHVGVGVLRRRVVCVETVVWDWWGLMWEMETLHPNPSVFMFPFLVCLSRNSALVRWGWMWFHKVRWRVRGVKRAQTCHRSCVAVEPLSRRELKGRLLAGRQLSVFLT